MTALNTPLPDDLDMVIDFTPSDEEAAKSIREYFAEDELLESNSFIGTTLITIIIVAGTEGLRKVFRYFLDHRKNLKDASVKIGKDEISLTGYSIKEVQDFIESGSIDKILKQINKSDKK
jgi:hypothetical protein